MSSWHLFAQVVEPVVASSPISRACCNYLQASVSAEAWNIGSRNPSESLATMVFVCSLKGCLCRLVSFYRPYIGLASAIRDGQGEALMQGPLSPIASCHGHLGAALHSEVKKKKLSLCIAVSLHFFHVLQPPCLYTRAECVSCSGW